MLVNQTSRSAGKVHCCCQLVKESDRDTPFLFKKVKIKKQQPTVVLNYIKFCTALTCCIIYPLLCKCLFLISLVHKWCQWSHFLRGDLELCILGFLMLKQCHCIKNPLTGNSPWKEKTSISPTCQFLGKVTKAFQSI